MSAAKFINGWLVECEAGTGKGAMPSLHLESQVVAGGGAGAGSVPEDAGEVPTDQFLDLGDNVNSQENFSKERKSYSKGSLAHLGNIVSLLEKLSSTDCFHLHKNC